MEEVWVALGMAAPLLVALSWAVWTLITRSRRQRRRRVVMRCAQRYHVEPSEVARRRGPAHLFHGQGEAVTVAELLEEAKEQGEGVRLNWPDTDPYEAGLVRPYVQDQFPTAILPSFFDDEDS